MFVMRLTIGPYRPKRVSKRAMIDLNSLSTEFFVVGHIRRDDMVGLRDFQVNNEKVKV